MKDYGIVFPNLPEDGDITYGEIEERWPDIIEKTEAFINKFPDLLEGKTGYGAVGPFEDDLIGVYFRGTEVLAQKVANEFSDLKVIDNDGNVISPK